MATLLVAWVIASIVLTPLIGYLLRAVEKPRRHAVRGSVDNRYRASDWTQLPARRQEYPRRNSGLLRSRRHAARVPN